MHESGVPQAPLGPVRRTRGRLNAALVVATAAEVADAEGLEAVSMRVLAERLDCTPRALYRHVAGKDEVLELLADAALVDLPEARLDLGWEDALLEFFGAFRALLVARPAVAQIIAGQVVAGENFRRHADRLIGVMLTAGFDEELAVEAVVALAYYTLGASLPGTGQPLHDRWRERAAVVAQESRPTLVRVAPRLAEDVAGPRFLSAMRRMVGGYALALVHPQGKDSRG